MKLFYKKEKISIVMMVVLAMLLQIVGPVAGNYVYARGEGEEAFRITNTRINEDGRATVYWEYDYTPDGETKFESSLELVLDGEKSGDLKAKEDEKDIKIGSYTISKDGEISVKIEGIDEIVEELLREDSTEQPDNQDPVDPEIPDPEESTDSKDPDKSDENDMPEGEEVDNSEDSSETENDETTTEKDDEDGLVEDQEDDSAWIMENVLGLFGKNVVYAEGEDREYKFSGSFDVDGVVEEEIVVDEEDENIEISTHSNEIVDVVDRSVIKKITATVNGENIAEIEPYRPSIGDRVDLKIDFILEENHNYGDGSKLTYELPTPLKAVNGSGDLAKDGEIYGTYSISEGKVIITFNENIRFSGEGGTGGLETIGDFSITAEYSKAENDNDLETDLELPGQDKITINFKPKDGSTITKSIDDKNNIDNIHELTWTVMVNTEMEDLGTGVEFKDILSSNPTGGHTYEKDSLKVYKLNIGADGSIIGNEENVTSQFTDVLNQDNLTSFELNLTGKFAYKIVYKTILNDERANDNGQLNAKNNASFNGQNKSDNITINYGKPLDKSVLEEGEKAKWTIRVNANKKLLESGLKITDTWDETMRKYHKLEGDIVVKKGDNTLTKDVDYSIEDIKDDEDNYGGFEITFTDAIEKEEVTIEYTTIPKDLITEEFTIRNTVTRGDGKGGEQGKNQDYRQKVIEKTVSKPNYQDKTVEWTIEINKAGYKMDNLVLKDVFIHENLKLKGDIEVKSNGSSLESSKYEIKHKDEDGNDANPNEPTKYGFDIEFKETVSESEKITVNFTTDYDVKGVDNLDKYKNEATITWGTNYESTDSAEVDINNQQKSKGYKDGWYNYEEKRFYWQVGINYNFDTVKNARFTDKLPESQVIDVDSIKVQELDLTGGGDGDLTGNPLKKDEDYTLTLNGNNEFTISFINENSNSINKPYRISYESTIKDDYYKPGTKYSVKNEANLTGDNNYKGDWNKEVTVEHSEDLILKGVKMTNPVTAKLEWELKLNYNQSTLNNVKITDIVGKDNEDNPNQKIYEDSFNIYPVTFSGKSPTAKVGLTPIDSSLYDLDVTEEGFTIEFRNEISTAYLIKYEAYFLGAPGDELKNEATLSYTTRTGTSEEDRDEYLNAKFNFSGSAFTKKGSLEITKLDADDNTKKLSGAEFKLWSAQTGGFLIETVSEDIDGVYSFKTKVGQTTYYLEETKAPEGYIADEYKQRKAVTIKDKGDPATPNYVEKITITNRKITQGVKLIKVDADDNGIKLSGAEFKLYKENSEVTKDANGNSLNLVTDDNGELILDNLAAGTYYFEEVMAPSNYLLPTGEDAKTKEFTITEGQTTVETIEVKNTRGKGKITIKKVDAGNNNIKLKDVEFKLIDSNGAVLKTGSTDINGVLVFDNLEYDKYTLVETKAPEGYRIVEGSKEVILDGETDDINLKVTIKNIQKTSITGHKVWIGGPSRKPTIELQLYRDGVKHGDSVKLENGETEYTWTGLDRTDKDGRVYKYTIDEVNTPSRYRKTISDDGLTVTNRYRPPTDPYEPPTDPKDPDPEDPKDPEEPEDPKDPEEPKDPEDPEEPKDPEDPTDPEDPEGPTIQEVPDPEDPEEPEDPQNPDSPDPEEPGDPDRPDPQDPEDPTTTIVLDPPTKGTVTFDEDGNWIYTPNPGATGKDSFTIVHPDGREELITIDLDDLPLGTVSVKNGQPILPRTGAANNLGFYLAGLSLIGLGIFLRKRKTI